MIGLYVYKIFEDNVSSDSNEIVVLVKYPDMLLPYFIH